MAWIDPPPPGYVIEGYQPPATFAVGLYAFVPFLPLALVNINAMLYGAFGLGPLQFEFKGQLSAALSAQLTWNPQAAIKANAAIGIALSGLIPDFRVNASLVAGLQLKIGGIQLLLNLGLSLMAQIPDLLAAVNAFFNLPSCYFAIYNGPAGGVKSLQAALPGQPNIAAMMIAAGYPTQIAGAQFVAAVGKLFTITM